MSFLNLFENASLAGWLANSAGQLIIISILGFIAVKFMSRESAPARSIAAAGALVSMLMVFILSVVFQASNIAWYKADVSRFTAQPLAAAKPQEKTPATVKPAIAAAPEQMTASENISMPALPTLPDINMENAFQAKPAPAKPAVISPKPGKPFQLKAAHCINALGLLWLCGIIFMLLKLGYGLAFIRGFRFGLNRILDARVDRLLKIAAETFNKQRLPELYTSPQVESPVTIGMVNPIVIIPEKLFATLSENELKSILLHELAHIYHYDHIIGVFKRIIIAANWWNPLAYRVSAKHAVAREEVADNYVLRELNPKIYSECLAGLAEKICLISSYPAAAGMAGNYSSLQHRVKDIMSKKRKLTMTTGTTFKLTTAAVCLMLALAVAGCRCGKPDPEPLTADAIIAKMAETYAKCKTYQDSGTVKTLFIKADGDMTIEKPFSTVFIRPNQFRFEYKEKVDSYIKEKPGYIVWRKGDEVLTWFVARPDITKVKSLDSGLAGATGVSSGSAHTIPALLMSEISGKKLSGIKEVKMLENAVFDGSSCYRIQGKFICSGDNGKVVKSPMIIWIDKNTSLVRRIDEQNVFPGSNFRTEDTTTYHPEININISAKSLDFIPPVGSAALSTVKEQEESPKLSLDSVKSNSLPDEKEARRLSMIGYGLSAKQAAELEQKLAKNPDDVNTITLLISYCHSNSADKLDNEKREKYILWMIEHYPGSAVLDLSECRLDSKSAIANQKAKKLWIEQVEKNPSNSNVLW
ncbi:MAG: M56 family metallopeptidase, partial [Victivallaceae bacterium]